MNPTNNSPQELEPNIFITDAVAAAKQNGNHVEIPVALAPPDQPPALPTYNVYTTPLNRRGKIGLAAGALAATVAFAVSAGPAIDYGPNKSAQYGQAAAMQKLDNDTIR